MIRKKKLYNRPRKLYVKSRITEENLLLEKYGLKNKHEVWKAIAKINYFRNRAKVLAKASPEEQQVLFNKLQKIGLKVNSISDTLALKIEDILERRLPTLVFRKNLAATPKHARQIVVHKKVFIGERIVNIPSYIVPLEEEALIRVKPAKKKAVAKTPEQAQEINTPEKEAS